ncbi:hypothetical protein D4A39_04325 [Alcanivorax profundi]|uniref:Uncharacterized protein n=1 Tax=Alcanivorax profundi TaxID=2338368 RepID=A0A418Y460_9GAMM|nr:MULTISPECIES: hypothetical protein [Alcanivorax]RJG20315.1 hypothetical protein D4A39_04325 [Alcanivorax profundi]
MKTTLRITAIAALLAGASLAEAAVTAGELATLEADAWRARMGFHLLSIRGDNPDDREALRILLAEGDQRLNEMVKEAEPGNEAGINALNEAWATLSERALDNPLASLGYADYGAMSEMNTTTLDVVELAESTRDQQTSAYLDIAELSVAMQRLASEYLALAAFPSAGLPTGTGLKPMDFAIESKGIDDRLKALNTQYAADTQASDVLDFVNQRWAFIRSTIPKMNDEASNKVPYLFYRYANQVAERIEELVEASKG